MTDRMIAIHAPICTTRLLPTLVNCRHPMFSLSAQRMQGATLSKCVGRCYFAGSRLRTQMTIHVGIHMHCISMRQSALRTQSSSGAHMLWLHSQSQ